MRGGHEGCIRQGGPQGDDETLCGEKKSEKESRVFRLWSIQVQGEVRSPGCQRKSLPQKPRREGLVCVQWARTTASMCVWNRNSPKRPSSHTIVSYGGAVFPLSREARISYLLVAVPTCHPCWTRHSRL